MKSLDTHVVLIILLSEKVLKCNLNDLHIASRYYDIILCPETLVSYWHHISELLIPDFSKPILLLKGDDKQGLATYIRTGFSASSRNDLT